MSELIALSGTVDSVIYKNSENGYAVVALVCGGELVTVNGEIGDVAEGEELQLQGDFTVHAVYGRQFRASLCQRSLPKNSEAIYKYLASGTIKGIGPKMAKKIVEEFGDGTFRVIESEPDKLSRIKGITSERAKQISEEYKRIYGIRLLMSKLAGYGVDASSSIKLWKKCGVNSFEMLSQDPYILCSDEIGMSFEAADAIAGKFGIDDNADCRLCCAVLNVLRYNLKNGFTYVPRDQLSSLTAKMLDKYDYDFSSLIYEMSQNGTLVIARLDGRDCCFLPAFFYSERHTAEMILDMLKEEKKDCDEISINSIIDQIENDYGIKYAGLQRQSIIDAVTLPMFILTGGPGTGKTTTLNAILNILEMMGNKVFLAAPTGRAAKRMTEITGREAKTVHRLLEVTFSSGEEACFKRNEFNPLQCEALIIDEISMIDIMLFESVLHALPQGCKLIMVGDSNQLPPVGAGNVLKDLMDCGLVPFVRLNDVFRQAAKSLIVTNAHLVVNGKMPDLSKTDNDFFYLPRKNGLVAENTIIDLCKKRLPAAYGFSPTTDIQVLTPSRWSDFGTVKQNKLLQEALNPPGKDKSERRFNNVVLRDGDKIMQIKNNYDIEWVRDNGEKGLGVFNGDIGFIEKVDSETQTVRVRYDDRVVRYPFDLCSDLEHAYAITVHKSQGSEFDAVIIPLFGGFDKLYYRNLLYTAITRAKKILIIVGEESSIRRMVNNSRKAKRFTALKYFLTDYESTGII